MVYSRLLGAAAARRAAVHRTAELRRRLLGAGARQRTLSVAAALRHHAGRPGGPAGATEDRRRTGAEP